MSDFPGSLKFNKMIELAKVEVACSDMKNSRILIIDDNKSVLSALELLLQQLCEEVVTSPNPNRIPSLLET